MGGISTEQVNFAHELANLAYGTGLVNEKTNGGKGNMGLTYDSDGNAHVFKCNTHGSDAKNMQKSVNAGAEGAAEIVRTSSNNLRVELAKLALSAGMSQEVVGRLLGKGEAERELLTRKMVANFLTELSKNCVELKNVWDNVKGIKSANDMTVEVVRQGEKFNRKVVDPNGAKKILGYRDGALTLANVNPFRNVLGGAAFLDVLDARDIPTEDFASASARASDLTARGFGWVAEGKSLASVIEEELEKRGLAEGLSPDERRRVAARLADEMSEGLVSVFAEQKNKDTFSAILENVISGRDLKELAKADMTLGQVLSLVEGDLENSKRSDLPRDVIRENIGVLRQVARKGDEALEHFDQFESKFKEQVLKTSRLSIQTAMSMAKILKLKDRTGKNMSIHETSGVENMLQSIAAARRFATIYQKACEQDKIEDLLLVLTEGGCFQARMDALMEFETRLDGAGNVSSVNHEENEKPAEGLTNELAHAVQVYMNEHGGEQPTWGQVKGQFWKQIGGRQFAGVNWTAHNVYKHLTKDILEYGMVNVDDEKKFKAEFEDIAAPVKAGEVHMGNNL